MSNCHFINLPFCQLTISSTCHFVNSPFCQFAMLSTCCFIFLSILTFHQITIFSSSHSVNSPFRQLAKRTRHPFLGASATPVRPLMIQRFWFLSSKRFSHSSKNSNETRVTRLGNFSTIGLLLEARCDLWKDEVAQNNGDFLGFFLFK